MKLPKNKYYCFACGSELPNDSPHLICEHCGVELDPEHPGIKEKLIKTENKRKKTLQSHIIEKKEVKTRNFNEIVNLEMKLFVCRRAYEFLNLLEYQVNHSKSLKLEPEQLKVLANDFRKNLKHKSMQERWLNELSYLYPSEFEKSYENFQESLKSKKIFRREYSEFFKNAIQLIYGLINDRIKSSENFGEKGLFIDDLKNYLSIVPNGTASNEFKETLTIFLAWIIYGNMNDPESDLMLTGVYDELTDSDTENIATSLMNFLKNQQIRDNWLTKFENRNSIKKFQKEYKKLQHDLKSDKFYYDVVFEDLRWLVRIICKLIKSIYNFDKLSGIKLEIVNFFKTEDLFEKDPNLSKIFKRNFIVIVSRLIYSWIKEVENFKNMQASQMDLAMSAVKSLANDLIVNILTTNKIRSELMDKLNEITSERFDRDYKNLKLRLLSDGIYKQSFLNYLQWRIIRIFELVADRFEVSTMENFEKTILKDLETYDFDKIKEILSKKPIPINEDNNTIKIEQDGKSRMPDIENLYILDKNSNKFPITAIIDTGASNPENLIDSNLANSLNLEIIDTPGENVQIAGTEVNGNKSRAIVFFRGVRMETDFLVVKNLIDIIKFPVLISKPTLMRYSELIGQDGKILLDLKDQPKNIPPILVAQNKNSSQTSDIKIWKTFLKDTHKNEVIKELISEFNKSGNWIKNLRPTKTFINFLKEKKRLLKYNFQSERSTNIKDQIVIISNYVSLINKVRDENILFKAIKKIILKNKGDFNAYDLEKWILISDTSARNQLKKMLTEEEYQECIRTQKHVTIDIIKKIAKKKGGKCHTKDIKNAKSRLHLECSESHHFFPTYDSVVYQDTWCPHCNIYVGETICRIFFEKIFKKPFPISYPGWLPNRMELDGYNKCLGLAFEYQGIQHRKRVFGMSDEEFQNIQRRDALKLKKCEENYVILLQIPDDEIVPYEEMQKYIENEYERKAGIILKNIPSYDYREFNRYENKHAKKFRKFVENKGGVLSTTYFSAKKEIIIICENGHHWKTTPDSIYRGNWCSSCSGNVKGTAEFFREIGENFGCNLISNYVNAKTALWYRCPIGHRFKKSPYWLKKNFKKIKFLCPDCKIDIYAKKFQDFISKKGWNLLTPYKGRGKPITIACEEGHDWSTTPGALFQGGTCRICRERDNPSSNAIRKEKAKMEFFQIIANLNYKILPPGYKDNVTSVNIRCRNSHVFHASPKYFKKVVKQGKEPCRKCSKNK